MYTNNDRNYQNRSRRDEHYDDRNRNSREESFNEFRGNYRQDHERPAYHHRGDPYFQGNRENQRDNYHDNRHLEFRSYRQPESRYDDDRRDYHSYDDRNFFERAGDRIKQTWNDWNNRDEWNEEHPYFNNRYRDQDYRSGERGREPSHYSEPYRSDTYKGRYYDRHETPQDKADIRRRYEESRRNSGWTNAYLPLNNY